MKSIKIKSKNKFEKKKIIRNVLLNINFGHAFSNETDPHKIGNKNLKLWGAIVTVRTV